ncbi:MAG: hypothetical protein K5769_01455 [Pseudobutyrivibrio sp.]|nr:hypothetical protein [Pseudobutyrivibrio sp.]
MFKNKRRIFLAAFILLAFVLICAGIASRFDVKKENKIKYKLVEPKSKETIWDKKRDGEIELDIDAPSSKDKYTLKIEVGESTFIDILCNGNEFFSIFADDIDAITGIKLCDVNFDGKMDVLMNVIHNKKQLAFVYGSDSYDISFNDNLVRVPESMYDDNLEYTVDDIELLLTNGKTNGEFKSYKEAYKSIVNSYTYILAPYYSDEEINSSDCHKFDLIYLDDDDVPELVVNTIFGIMVYTFKDGYTYSAINDCDDYNYVHFYCPRESIIQAVGYDDDPGIDEYITYYRYSSTGFKAIYGENRLCDYDEPHKVEEVIYSNLTDEELSKSELIKKAKKYSEKKYKEIKMEYSAPEILEEL